MRIISINQCKGNIKLACLEDNETEIDRVYYHKETNTYYNVVNIEINAKGVHVNLESYGNWRSFVKDFSIAKNMLYDELELVTDEEKLSNLKRSSCYC